MRLGFAIPADCSASYLTSLLPARRAVARDDRAGGPALTLSYNGTSEDREAARTELAAALVESGSLQRHVGFADETV